MKSLAIPQIEADQLISYSRTEDMLIGPLGNLYFHMSYAGVYVCRKTFSIQRTGVNTLLLILTTAGEGKLSYQNKEYRLVPGSIMLIDGRIPHEYYALEDGWTFKYLHFRGALSDSYLTYIQTQFGPVFQPSHHVFLEAEERLNDVMRHTEAPMPPDYAAVSGCIYAILTSLLSQKNTGDSQSRSASAIQQAVAYIVENYRRPISTQEIADAVYLSRSYMSELFAKTYGMAPHEYLTMYRLTRVKNYLVSTSASVSEIAERTGFRDIFTLSRIFKKNSVCLRPNIGNIPNRRCG